MVCLDGSVSAMVIIRSVEMAGVYDAGQNNLPD
jgi:hypothetical protein